MDIISLFIFAAVLSLMLTGLLRRYAISRSLMDNPNERSSHSIPTPRGGGVAITITFLIGLVVLVKMSLLEYSPFVAISVAGLLVTIIGFIDDHGHIAARWRLVAHFSAAGWLLFWLSGLPTIYLFDTQIDLGWAGHLLALVALVWLLNLYNFMDGIDGLAGIEALSSTLVAGLLFLLVLDNQEMAMLNLLMSASVAGFLVWNFPPAKIFLGDAGSGFLGLMLGALVLHGAHIVPQMLWVWMILLGVFIVDATFTLIRRLLCGDKVYEAHRSHAYQHAANRWGSGHLPVTLAVTLINIFWLTPLAWFALTEPGLGFLLTIIAYLPLIILAVYFKAGKKQSRYEL